MFSADHVWALAVVADRTNGGYLKEDEWLPNATPPCRGREANKKMVKTWLREGSNPTTAADVEEGQEIRHYFKGLLFRGIAGKLNEFEANVLRIAQKDEFTGRDMLDFAIVSCLPSMMIRDKARTEIDRAVYDSQQLQGSIGDKIIGDIEVLSCYWSNEYSKYKIRAKLVDSYVDFWYNNSMEQGSVVSIKGKIKAQRDDKTTQLNFVKRV